MEFMRVNNSKIAEKAEALGVPGAPTEAGAGRFWAWDTGHDLGQTDESVDAETVIEQGRAIYAREVKSAETRGEWFLIDGTDGLSELHRHAVDNSVYDADPDSAFFGSVSPKFYEFFIQSGGPAACPDCGGQDIDLWLVFDDADDPMKSNGMCRSNTCCHVFDRPVFANP